MSALTPIWREIRILFFRWALAEIQPTHEDVPKIVMRLNDLVAERPRPALRNRCAGAAGMCMRDAACADYNCEGHPWQQLHFVDGGHQVDGEVSVRVHAQPEPRQDNRPLLWILGAAAIATGCAAAIALGCPICLPF